MKRAPGPGGSGVTIAAATMYVLRSASPRAARTASGRSSRQVIAMSDKLSERLKAETGRSCRVEGKANGDWVLLDCGDVVVHIFRPEVREFYQLEKMWLPANVTTASV